MNGHQDETVNRYIQFGL